MRKFSAYTNLDENALRNINNFRTNHKKRLCCKNVFVTLTSVQARLYKYLDDCSGPAEYQHSAASEDERLVKNLSLAEVGVFLPMEL